MASTKNYAVKQGTLKITEFTWDFVDGLVFTVIAALDTTTINAGNFTVQTSATIDTALWPAAGHFYINDRLFTYTAISGSTFTGCYGPYGNRAVVAIADGEIGYQAAPDCAGMLLFDFATKGWVYKARAQTGLNVSIGAFPAYDGTTRLTYAGGTLALTDNATNYIYAYNNAGTLTIDKNTTSFEAARGSVGGSIIELAIITTLSGAITVSSYSDERSAFELGERLVAYKLSVNDNSTVNQVILPIAHFKKAVIEYYLIREQGATDPIEEGTITICHDGTNAYIRSESSAVVGASGVTFNADISGGNLRLNITSDASGGATELRLLIRRL